MAVSVPWKTRWKDKIQGADAAVARINSGDTVFIGTGAAQPETLCLELAARAGQVHDVEIYHLLTLGDAPYIGEDKRNSFRVNAFFIAPNARDAVQKGLADYTPIFLSDIPSEFSSGRIALDVALIQTSPPDENGFMTFGVSVDIVKAAAENARIVIAEVNDQMPRVLGDTLIHVNEVDALVPVSRPLPEYRMPEPDDRIRRIARHLADLIEDGSTVQIGIGRIPQAVVEHLTQKRNLGIHTEMFTDSIMGLIQSGAVTCTQKTINRGKVVATFCMGTRELYEFVDGNPFLEFYPTEYVNDPYVIAQHMDMVSINVALEIDLTGQVCADSLGHKFYSGFGGQVDFTRGAARAKNGKPIIAMPSTAKSDTISRIVPLLSPGAGVTITRADVYYVVTEYGVAYLHGKSVQERALALINIAHPKFRPDLLKEAKRFRYVREEQEEIVASEFFAQEGLEHRATLHDGTEILFRPIKPTDDRALRDMLYSLSPESIYYRFFQPLKQFSFAYRQKLVNVNFRDELPIVGCVARPGGEEIVAAGRYIREPGRNTAEVAFLVQDEWQNKGMGSHLLRFLARCARKSGITQFRASVLRNNKAMLNVFHSSGYHVYIKLDEDVYNLTIDLGK
ncbi:MAG TPA: GNAT family N-acetyltransferase [Planctomycetota bacterium]|jgi:acyl-CoA hydrolase|nr:MAG: Succinyl-CoA:coenzyme A transferase [Planctomycetes bacterium ADurb.Bin069]HNR98766.1 GNAT family N-acetyltransferase [Planctomycetota bacterium]HNU25474.1 GNAT family N-acetyltransferase [Planctomycetota bacterium]HOE30402.1 GNAT family N-acetyltransferase [Planctomycetota bacterium]HOE87673.1 GNAT family N-acetyltransferase [Planctomycetota bacterium]